ncbi:MAG: carbohydrate binding domain-containing protein, partial [Lentisphaeria bacterium]|nr:carbohydrate binding domain-containing protein [Lentisphaeria bacterium]
MMTTGRWFLVTAILSVGLLAAPRSPLRNTGFESGGKSVGNWSVPTYWSGAVEPCTENPHGGKRCAKITTSTSRGRVWGRILHQGTIKPEFGRKIRYSAWVRGNGEILLGVIRYTQKTPGKPNYQYLWQEPVVQLGNEWREIVLEFRIMDPKIIRLCPVIEVRGEGAIAYVDEVAYEPVVSKDVVAKIAPNHPLATPGRSTGVVFSAERKGQPLTGSVTLLVVPPEGEPSSIELPLDDRGQATYRFAPKMAAADPWRLVFLHGESGASATVYADAMSADAYESMGKAAKALPAKPRHLLFIGDSLSDQKRGYNYVDKIGYWLSERTDGQGTVKNVGVGGDYISRVWQRLNKNPKSYRLNMYEDIFKPKPSRVFIFLGHNDSKAKSTTNYTTHCVNPATFEEEYR